MTLRDCTFTRSANDIATESPRTILPDIGALRRGCDGQVTYK